MLQWNTIIHSKNLKTIVIPNNKDGTSIIVCILILSTFIEGIIRKRDFPVSIITNKWKKYPSKYDEKQQTKTTGFKAIKINNGSNNIIFFNLLNHSNS